MDLNTFLLSLSVGFGLFTQITACVVVRFTVSDGAAEPKALGHHNTNRHALTELKFSFHALNCSGVLTVESLFYRYSTDQRQINPTERRQMA